jgi:hypothetical protein
MRVSPSFKHLSDVQLTHELARLAQHERHATCALIACLEEFDRRRLYLGLGFPSLYAFCKQHLHLSEDAAYKRVEVARASRRCPELLDMINDGRLSLTSACLLAKVAMKESLDLLLPQAAFRSSREVELLIAAHHPQPPVPAVIRKLPDLPEPSSGTTGDHESASADASQLAHSASLADQPPPVPQEAPGTLPPASRRPLIRPISESQYKLQVTISAAAVERLRQIQDLMRHRLPSGDPAAIVEHALEVLHAELLKKKAAEVTRPRPARAAGNVAGRHIPAAVKRLVFKRDKGACAFVSDTGARCGSTSGVEFHHVRPVAVGGEAIAENIELRCRAHNQFEWTRHEDRETESLMSSG